MNFRLARDQVVLLETTTNEPAGEKQTISSQFFSSFELGGITKHLITAWPLGKQLVLFPLDLNGDTKLGDTKLTVSLGASH